MARTVTITRPDTAAGEGSELNTARLRIAVARLSRRLKPTAAAGSMTTTEVDVLVAIDRHGPLRLSDLAGFAGLNPTMLSRLIPKLEVAGVMRRLVAEGDRRVCRVEITAKGRRLPRAHPIGAQRFAVTPARFPERRGPGDTGGCGSGARNAGRADAGTCSRCADGCRVSRILAVSRRTFSALSIPNFRRYFFGQSTSLIGTWMQSVAQSWLVFTLTHSATAIGFVLALQTLPVLILGPYGGVIADRVDKRRLMIALQTMMGIQALVLGLLVVMHVVVFWEICVLAVVLGLNNCFENPARQSFVREMVGAGQVRNAVSLNSTMVNAARAVGPAVAGLLIATVGVGVCFLVNAVSFVAVVYSLVSMDTKALSPSEPTARARGQLREGFRYVAHTPRLGIPLLMMAIVGTLAYEFQVTLPVLAKVTFGGNAATYGFLASAMGIGAVAGGLVTATRGRRGCAR